MLLPKIHEQPLTNNRISPASYDIGCYEIAKKKVGNKTIQVYNAPEITITATRICTCPLHGVSFGRGIEVSVNMNTTQVRKSKDPVARPGPVIPEQSGFY